MQQGPAAVPAPPLTLLEQGLYGQGLSGQDSGPPGLGPTPGRTHEPGGDLLRQLLHPNLTVLDRLFRKLPEDGMFSPNLTQDRPFQFVIGSFTVPGGTALWLSDYRFGVLLFDGVAAGDFRYAEDGRFSGSLCFDLVVNNRRQGDLAYELDPQPIDFNRPEFQTGGPVGVPIGPAPEPSASFGSVAGIGSSGLPMQREVQGPHNRNPWTWVIDEDQTVVCRCIVFRQLKSPIAGVFATLGGHLLHVNTSRALVERLRPR